MKNICDKINNVDYFLFDFDGTIRPNTLLLELALDFLSNYSGDKKISMKSKYEELIQLVKDRDKKSFLEISLEFAKILRGIPCSDFNKKIPYFLNNCYPCALEFVHTLKQKNKKCFLISLTSYAIAEVVAKQFEFDGYWCRGLKKTKEGGVEVFTGTYDEDVLDLSEFKKLSLSKFSIHENEKIFMAGDSFEDHLLFDLAYIKIGVNPEKKLLNNNVNFDIILNGKKDPWHEFSKIIQQYPKI